jgi:hypothetical protein
MAFTPETIQFLQTVGAGCIGSVVGAASAGFISYNSQRVHYARTMRDRAAEQRRGELALLDVFASDLTSLRKLHTQMSNILSTLPEGEPLDSIVPVSLNYFSVFENNVANFGMIRKPELISQLIDTYHRAKGLIDSLRSNNEMVAEFRRWTIEFEEGKSELAKGHRDRVRARMVGYARFLKDSSAGWLGEIDRTQAMIENHRLNVAL